MNRTDAQDEQALAALLDTVSFVTTELQARGKRDALLAVTQPALSALTQRIVSAFGFQSFCLTSIAEAAPTAGGRRFDLIVLEADSDAAHWVRRIRDLPQEFGAAPILALGGGEPWRKALMQSGVDAYVAEPTTPARIVDALALLLGARSEA